CFCAACAGSWRRRDSTRILGGMTSSAIKRLLTKRPFEPFQVVMSSGERYAIKHPEMALLTKRTLYIGIGDLADGIPADAEFCSLLHVTAVEPLRNGRPKKKRQ